MVVAVCSTSNDLLVSNIVEMMGGNVLAKMAIFVGDVVAGKKPAPDIYLLACHRLGVRAGNEFGVKDCLIGRVGGYSGRDDVRRVLLAP